MKLKHMSMLACMAAMVSLSGCATTGSSSPFGNMLGQKAEPTTNPDGTVKAPEQTRQQARNRGFLKGCGVGALMGVLSRSPEAAIAGCALGGVAEARVSTAQYDAQMAQARAFQQATVTVGVLTKVETSKVNVEAKQADGTTKVEQVEKLDCLHVPMKAERVNAQDPQLADVLKKLGTLAAEDKTGVPMVITIEGPDGKRSWVRQQINASVAGSQVQVLEKTAPAFAVEVSPIPTSSK